MKFLSMLKEKMGKVTSEEGLNAASEISKTLKEAPTMKDESAIYAGAKNASTQPRPRLYASMSDERVKTNIKQESFPAALINRKKRNRGQY